MLSESAWYKQFEHFHGIGKNSHVQHSKSPLHFTNNYNARIILPTVRYEHFREGLLYIIPDLVVNSQYCLRAQWKKTTKSQDFIVKPRIRGDHTLYIVNSLVVLASAEYFRLCK